MNNLVFEAHEVARSFEVFTDPNSYKPFDLTRDCMRIVGCIDPRDEEGDLKVVIQTGGGAAGRGLDSQLSLTANDRPTGRIYTIEEGLDYDVGLQRTTVAGGHNKVCRFIYGLVLVGDEMAAPSDFTLDTLSSLRHRYELESVGFSKVTRKIIDSVNCSMDTLRATEPVALLNTIDGLYPYHPNVRDMVGSNRAGFYIFNHHPYVGLDRSLVHRGTNPLTVHAYHDSPRAMVDSLAGTLGMPKSVKELRLGALLLRTAATRTVLCKDDENIRLLDVVPTRHGVQVEESFI